MIIIRRKPKISYIHMRAVRDVHCICHALVCVCVCVYRTIYRHIQCTRFWADRRRTIPTVFFFTNERVQFKRTPSSTNHLVTVNRVCFEVIKLGIVLQDTRWHILKCMHIFSNNKYPNCVSCLCCMWLKKKRFLAGVCIGAILYKRR